jgi:hypothetical protein
MMNLDWIEPQSAETLFQIFFVANAFISSFNTQTMYTR